MPEREWKVFKKIEEKGDARVREITDAVFQGIMTGAKGIFVVEVLDADQITSDDSGDVVTIRPTGTKEEYEVETDVLRPFIDGKEVERWQVNWSGLHLVHPYTLDGDESVLLTEEHLSENLPKTWDYLSTYEDELRSRSSKEKAIGMDTAALRI